MVDRSHILVVEECWVKKEKILARDYEGKSCGFYRTFVKIPFLPEFKDRMINGLKTATTRTRPMGDPGDYFVAFGKEFQIYSVINMELEMVVEEYFKQEGFKTPQEVIDIWNKIHPIKKYYPNQRVYLHLFQFVGDTK